MQFIVYWLISEDCQKTYVGFSDNIKRRISEHRKKLLESTRGFGVFRCFKLEEVDNRTAAREREKYWKSAAGRRKLQKIFEKIIK